MCLQLTDALLNSSSQKLDEWMKEKEVAPPLVRLGNGEVTEECASLLSELLADMQQDTELDVNCASAALLKTQIHIVGRVDAFCKYPTRLWRITKMFNASGYMLALSDFLNEEDDDLDAGYSLP